MLVVVGAFIPLWLYFRLRPRATIWKTGDGKAVEECPHCGYRFSTEVETLGGKADGNSSIKTNKHEICPRCGERIKRTPNQALFESRKARRNE
jgi:DNA-directed RNA polymerase subunit RPC12/RpoP